MKTRSIVIRTTFALIPLGFAATSVSADDRQPTKVVELFTSQGCSSCPPANANLVEVSKQTGVLALSYSVTYWDYLGWKDTFGKKEFTERQINYETPLGQSGPYTPQMIVNGATTTIGNDLRKLQSTISQTARLKGPTLKLQRDRLTVGALAGIRSADIWLVRYDPQIRTVEIARGENSGAHLQHAHVVHRLDRLGAWKGRELSFTLPPPENDLKTAVLVQQPDGGKILAAVTD